MIENTQFSSMAPRLTVRTQTVKKFRELLEAHIGPRDWVDEEVQKIADDMLNLVQLLATQPKSDL